MPRTAASIIREALRISKTGQLLAGQSTMSGYTQDALDALNSCLDFISETVDLARATRKFSFTFAPNLVTFGGGNVVTAAPNPLPIGYQRVETSGGATGAQRSTLWYLNGVPYRLVELDLAEWDMLVQQAGIQSYPYYAAKDMSGGAILCNFQGDLDSTSNIVKNIASLNPVTGAPVPGLPGAGPQLAVGMTIDGGIGPLTPIVPGTTITAITPGPSPTITLSQLPNYRDGSPGTTWSGTMSGASLMAGWAANLLIYPPPSGSFNAQIRYQSYMPPLTQTQVNAGAYCWYPDDQSLIDLLARRLMAISDDSRLVEYEQMADRLQAKYRRLADDRANRAQTVQMDERYFGHDFSRLKNTKTIGWLVLLCVGLGGMIGALPC